MIYKVKKPQHCELWYNKIYQISYTPAFSSSDVSMDGFCYRSTSRWSWRTQNILDIWVSTYWRTRLKKILKSEGNVKVDRRMTRPNLTLLFEPRPFRTIFSTCGRTVRLIYVQVIVSILLSLYFSSTKSSLNWNIWKAVFFYETLSTNVSESVNFSLSLTLDFV